MGSPVSVLHLNALQLRPQNFAQDELVRGAQPAILVESCDHSFQGVDQDGALVASAAAFLAPAQAAR